MSYIDREKLLQDISETVLFSVRGDAELPTPEMRGANKVIDRIRSAPAVNESDWKDVKTELPTKEGWYLCVFDHSIRGVLKYSFDLESVDKYDFEGEKRSGWYDYDSEWGYYELTDVTHWMPFPELPKREDESHV